jgi:hypothetical protein
MIFHSFGGGTGSGFAAHLLQRLSADYENEISFSDLQPMKQNSPIERSVVPGLKISSVTARQR